MRPTDVIVPLAGLAECLVLAAVWIWLSRRRRKRLERLVQEVRALDEAWKVRMRLDTAQCDRRG